MFRFTSPYFEILKGKELKSGFELYIDEFDLQMEKENLKPKLGFFDKIRGKQQKEISNAPPEIEARLIDCKLAVSFVWHAGDSFAFRFASLTSVILTELTNCLCSYEDDTWYENKFIVETAFKEVVEYEDGLSEAELDFLEFDQW